MLKPVRNPRVNSRSIRLSDYTTVWDENILSMKKPATIASMRSHIRRINENFGAAHLEKITEQIVQKHIAKVCQELSPRATRNYWGTFRLILSRAQKEGLIAVVPEPVLPKAWSQPQPVLGLEQMRELSRREVLWFLFSETGLRAGEAFGLKNSDINLKECTLTVNRSVFNGSTQHPKTSNGFRTLCLSPLLAGKISGVITGNPEAFLFSSGRNTALRQTYMLERLHQDLKGIGCPVTGFHAFRRGNATLLSEIGAPIKMISYRHGRITGDQTVDIYIKHRMHSDRVFAEKLGEILGS
jgi:integrase